MIRVAVVTNIIPNYRKSVYDLLFANKSIELTVYCQSVIPGMNLVTFCPPSVARVRILKSWTASHEGISWQHLPVKELWRNYDVLVFYGNPRILSNVLWATLFRFLGKPIIIWGQAHSYHASHLTESIRIAWWRWFRYLFVYTDREAELLRSRGFHHQTVIGMNNGLDQPLIDSLSSQWPPQRLTSWRQAQGIASNTVILLSIGRLDPKCRFDLMVASLEYLAPKHSQLMWVVIGDGVEAKSLKTRVAALGLEPYVRWLGAIYQEELLSPWFLSAKILIHPGAIGLSLLHAFGYGLPVITHSNPKAHGPEFVAMQDGVTGSCFDAGDSKALTFAIENLLRNPQKTLAMGREARRRVRETYNVKVMSERFQAIVTAAYTENNQLQKP
jgi:glycosyltransferase involved in cell wall biosynthesis